MDPKRSLDCHVRSRIYDPTTTCKRLLIFLGQSRGCLIDRHEIILIETDLIKTVLVQSLGIFPEQHTGMCLVDPDLARDGNGHLLARFRKVDKDLRIVLSKRSNIRNMTSSLDIPDRNHVLGSSPGKVSCVDTGVQPQRSIQVWLKTQRECKVQLPFASLS